MIWGRNEVINRLVKCLRLQPLLVGCEAVEEVEKTDCIDVVVKLEDEVVIHLEVSGSRRVGYDLLFVLKVNKQDYVGNNCIE